MARKKCEKPDWSNAENELPRVEITDSTRQLRITGGPTPEEAAILLDSFMPDLDIPSGQRNVIGCK